MLALEMHDYFGIGLHKISATPQAVSSVQSAIYFNGGVGEKVANVSNTAKKLHRDRISTFARKWDI